MTKVVVSVVGGNIVIAGIDAPLEIVTATPPPPVDPPPVDPPPPPPPPPPPVDPPPVTPTGFIWVDPAHLRRLPTTGTAWTEVENTADAGAGTATLSDQNSKWSTNILATAYAWVATGKQAYYDKAFAAFNAVVNGNLEKGARALGLARELQAIVVAADVMQVKTLDPALHAKLVAKFRDLLTFSAAGGPGSLIESMEKRPNNWGTHATCAVALVARYIGDAALLAHVATVFRGLLGDWDSYHGFTYGDLDWQYEKNRPLGINRKGATIQGHNVDGALPEELRRGGAFSWPLPAKPPTTYPWEAMQGITGTMWVFEMAGMSMLGESDQAYRRAVTWLYEVAKWPTDSDDGWQVPIINRLLGTSYPITGGSVGKGLAWTPWTHQ